MTNNLKPENPYSGDYLKLFNKVYKDKGIRPLSKAMVETSKLWKELKAKRKKEI